MPDGKKKRLCSDERLKALVDASRADESRGLRLLDELLSGYPSDPRLLFFKGSLLAGAHDYGAARIAMRQAVDAAPDYAIARFQLGFLELTSGEPIAAQESWGPLHSLPADHFLRLFVTGLCHLIRDEFADTIRCLEDGISRNRENLPLNRDMQLIIDEIRTKPRQERGDAAVSSVGLLLQQASFNPRKH